MAEIAKMEGLSQDLKLRRKLAAETEPGAGLEAEWTALFTYFTFWRSLCWLSLFLIYYNYFDYYYGVRVELDASLKRDSVLGPSSSTN